MNRFVLLIVFLFFDINFANFPDVEQIALKIIDGVGFSVRFKDNVYKIKDTVNIKYKVVNKSKNSIFDPQQRYLNTSRNPDSILWSCVYRLGGS